MIILQGGGFSCKKDFHVTKHTPRIKALFWESKKAVNPPETHLSIDNFTLTKINAKEDSADTAKAKTVSVSVVSSILDVPSSGWDACCLDATGPQHFNPFLSHGFLSSLEESGSAIKVRNIIIIFTQICISLYMIASGFFQETGWLPRHIVAQDEYNNILGVIPLYLKRSFNIYKLRIFSLRVTLDNSNQISQH